MPAPGRSDVPIAVRRSMRALGEHLTAWRKLSGLTQSQLADRAGVHRDAVRRVEGGEGTASVDTLLRLFNALGIIETVVQAADPYETDIGRLRADERLPSRVRPRDLRSGRG